MHPVDRRKTTGDGDSLKLEERMNKRLVRGSDLLPGATRVELCAAAIPVPRARAQCVQGKRR